MIGRYRVLGVLGAGGMGRVLLGAGPDGRFVAIKRIHPHLVEDTDYRARFEREITVSMRVSGAFTAALIDYQLTGPAPWLASVFIPGMPLDRAVDQLGPLPVPALRVLASGLASALHSIHGTGLVHRDLKPANVILAADGPRVIDFGIAQSADGGVITEVGSLIGSPAYMSPEQATGQPMTGASDVFSLGSLLFLAATGESPFAAASAAYTMFNIVHREVELDRVPAELRALLSGCLAKDPADRPTPAQILDHLGVLPARARPWPDAVHAEIERRTRGLSILVADPDATHVLAPAPPPAPEPAPPRRRRRGLVLGVAAAVLAVLAAATVFALRDTGDGPAAAGPAVHLPATDRWRGVDACAWLLDALGPELPADAGAESATDSWVWRPGPAWGCEGSSSAGRLNVDLGAGTDLFTDSGETTAGLPLLRREGDCAVAVDGGAAPRLGLVVTGSGGACALTEYTLGRLLGALDRLPPASAASSLASVDPCSLVGEAELAVLGGSGSGTALSAHDCEWAGESRLRVTLALTRNSSLPVLPRYVDLGDGVQVLRDDYDRAGVCTRLFRFRSVGETYVETVTVRLEDSQRKHEDVCAVADGVVRPVAGRLPAA